METLAYSNEVTPMPWEGDVAAGDSGSPYVRGNIVQKRDATLPGRRPESRSWAKLDIKEARAATGPELARPLRRGSPGLLGLSGCLFSRRPHGPVSAYSLLAQTWHSKIEIRDDNR